MYRCELHIYVPVSLLCNRLAFCQVRSRNCGAASTNTWKLKIIETIIVSSNALYSEGKFFADVH